MTDKLEKLVNDSGFLFQIRVEEEVERTSGKHGWSVASREHPWVDRTSQPVKGHFLDLVLQKGNTRIAVECKRSRGASWVFLTEPEGLTGEPGRQQHLARVLLVKSRYQGEDVETWRDFDVRPSTLEAEFCVVRGGEDQGSLLERLGRHLVDASEELGRLIMSLAPNAALAVVVPVIVTNAQLFVCAADPSKISLDKGEITGGNFHEVEYIRFRKSLAQRFTTGARLRTVREADQDLQRTVFVVNAEHLVPLLTRWSLSEIES